jgi:hypothetical protein
MPMTDAEYKSLSDRDKDIVDWFRWYIYAHWYYHSETDEEWQALLNKYDYEQALTSAMQNPCHEPS